MRLLTMTTAAAPLGLLAGLPPVGGWWALQYMCQAGRTPADLGMPEGTGYAEAFQDGDAASTCECLG